MRWILAFLLFALSVPLNSLRGEEENEVSIKSIVSRALPAVRKGGEKWIKSKDCLSCHRVGFQIWALNRASEKAFESDPQQLKDWNEWATTWQNLVNPKRRDETSREKALGSESDTLAQLLLGRPEAKGKPEPAWVEPYQTHLLDAQQESGSWNPAGQLPMQKRPKRETEEVTTMWTLLGLASSTINREKLQSATEKALDWLGTETKAESTEWWATRLVLEGSLNHESKSEELRDRLLGFQQDDGGWGWLTKDTSDALGTGIALYALARDGITKDHPSVQNAIKFLASSQQDSGSWKVHGTKRNARDRVTETASYWGTCWAVIGLVEFD